MTQMRAALVAAAAHAVDLTENVTCIVAAAALNGAGVSTGAVGDDQELLKPTTS
jgi:hypothetical protein